MERQQMSGKELLEQYREHITQITERHSTSNDVILDVYDTINLGEVSEYYIKLESK